LIALALPMPASEAIAVFTFVTRAASLVNSPAPRLDESSRDAQAESPSTAAATAAPRNLTRFMLLSFG
jgi:hypothetical protein